MPPDSDVLIDRTGRKTVATTDPKTNTVFLAEDLQNGFLRTVFLHELGHVVLLSFGLSDVLEEATQPERLIEVEEMICNLIADYGELIFRTAEKVLGDQAIAVVPGEINRAFAREEAIE